MDGSDSHYVHGTERWEQERLSRLNVLLNTASLEAMAPAGGERILDVGSGLGQFSRLLARHVGADGSVTGIERDADQLAEARRQAETDGESDLVDFRQGDAFELPLADDEWGSFDIVHSRFVLEHVTDPLAVVRGMVRAARPGGRIVLEDDDHHALRLWPEVPAVLELWRAYYETYDKRNKDSAIGRRLVSLLHDAGATPVSSRSLNFGRCAGDPDFDAMIANFAGVIAGARAEIATFGLLTDSQVDTGFNALSEWQQHPAATLWYSTCWACARK